MLCAHPSLDLPADDKGTGFVAGVPARYMREMWQTDDNTDFIVSNYRNGICGQGGAWFESNEIQP